MKSLSLSEPMNPNERRSERPEDGRGRRAVSTTVLGLYAMVAAWFFLTHLLPKFSAEILQGLLLAGMGWLAASLTAGLIAALRGKEAMEKLATAGHRIATVFASIVLAIPLAGLLWRYVGRPMLGLLGIHV